MNWQANTYQLKPFEPFAQLFAWLVIPLNIGLRNRKNMKRILLIILIQLTVAFALLIPSLTTEWIMAQGQIITVPMPANNTKLILDMKNHTQTLVNATTNETLSVENFTLYRGNATTNESLTTNAGNATTNESLTTNAGNATTNENLTAEI